MTEQIIAYCGLTCTDCPAYIATREDDTEKLKTMALEWYGVENDATFCVCDGCITDGRKNRWCGECAVRACAVERGVVNCAHCDEYGCETLTAFFGDVPDAKVNLERIRATL
ncbi:MAG: DUF3795 domain-containing protein [Chloroflexota bacterium]|nr:DUF3795 domain-containing protein [Chloroflexota bacterium]